MKDAHISETSRPLRYVLQRLFWVLAIVLMSFGIRGATAYFMAFHLDDTGWFQYGSYKIFDERAQNIIDGNEPIFFLNDPSRTDLIQYPPAFPVLVGLIYMASGERSSYTVLRVQWAIDAMIMPLLILGIAVTAFGWRVGYVAGTFAALSPLLASYGVTPSADASTTWVVLAAVWLLLLAAKGTSWKLALASGIILGAACWFRVNPLFMIVFWAATLVFFVPAAFAVRIRLSLALVLGTILLVAPLMVRNIVVFHEFVLTGLSVGSNLWEGLGETEFGRSQGFEFGDEAMVERERAELGLPANLPMTPMWPDGIGRDRERARKSLALIVRQPVWYSGVMLERMWWMLKIAGDPGVYYGTAGINITPARCLPSSWQGGLAAVGVKIVGMLQSVYRYLALPLTFGGVWLGFRRGKQMTALLLSAVVYYLVTSSAAHTELRYVLPMHAVLIVFSALGSVELASFGSQGMWKVFERYNKNSGRGTDNLTTTHGQA